MKSRRTKRSPCCCATSRKIFMKYLTAGGASHTTKQKAHRQMSSGGLSADRRTNERTGRQDGRGPGRLHLHLSNSEHSRLSHDASGVEGRVASVRFHFEPDHRLVHMAPLVRHNLSAELPHAVKVCKKRGDHTFFECFSLCLSRACLGKMITFSSYQMWHRKKKTRRFPYQSAGCGTSDRVSRATCGSPPAAQPASQSHHVIRPSHHVTSLNQKFPKHKTFRKSQKV